MTITETFMGELQAKLSANDFRKEQRWVPFLDNTTRYTMEIKSRAEQLSVPNLDVCVFKAVGDEASEDADSCSRGCSCPL